MKISVVIPTYKPQDYIWECLDSLVRQTFPKNDFEVIIVLNGCCEPWKGKIEKYISQNMTDMNIKFIQTDTGGVSNARNIALDCVQGEFVTFIDDDDFVSNSFLEGLYEVSDKDTVALSNAFAFNDGFKDVAVDYKLSEIYDNYSNCGNLSLSSKVRKYFSGPWMKLIPMNFIQERRFDVRFKNGEDSLFMFLISDRIQSIRFSDKKTIYYRRYRDFSAISHKGSLVDRIVNSAKLIREYCIIAFKYRVSMPFFITRVLGALKAIFITY